MDRFVQAYASTPLMRDDYEEEERQHLETLQLAGSSRGIPAIPRFELPNVNNVSFAIVLCCAVICLAVWLPGRLARGPLLLTRVVIAPLLTLPHPTASSIPLAAH